MLNTLPKVLNPHLLNTKLTFVCSKNILNCVKQGNSKHYVNSCQLTFC